MKKITLFISAILFTIFINGQCNEPTNVHINNDFDSIGIIWDANGASYWDIEYGEAGFTPTGTPTEEDLSYPKFDLMYNPIETGIYVDFYVRADCGGTTSDWVGPFTFYNHCFDRVWSEFLVEEDFEGEFIPECWTETSQGAPDTGVGLFGNSAWLQSDFANDSSNSLGAKVNISGTDVNEWLVLPPMRGLMGCRDDWHLIINISIALTEANSINPANLGSDDVIKLVISPDLGETWFVIHMWDTNTTISNTGEYFDVFYENYTHGFDLFEGIFLVAFWVNSGTVDDSENIDFFIDNLFAEPPFSGSITDLKSKGFTYYPNPSKNILYLTAKETINKVTIYNSLGQEVQQNTINSLSDQLDISDLPNGVYYMRVSIGHTIGVVSVLKD